MNKTYYISEVSVSDRHGSGITLQKIVGDDLQNFDKFIHLTNDATEVYPIIDCLKERQLNLNKLFPFPPNPVKFSPQYFRLRLAQILQINRILRDSDISQIRKFAGYLWENIEFKNSRWLVMPQGRFAIETVNLLYSRQPFKYVTWIMDDQVIRRDENGWYYPDYFEDTFKLHLQQASKVLVISPAMADIYREKFDIEAEVVFSPSSSVVQSPDSTPVSEAEPLRFCYFGAIRAWQLDALEVFSGRLAEVNGYLDIYTFDSLPASLHNERIKQCNPLPTSQVSSQMSGYDAVIIPISFKEQLRNLSELNIATKLSECLSSGTVTVLIGPEYAAMVQFVRKYGGGLIINPADVASLLQVKQIKNPSIRKALLAQAHYIAQTITSFQTMRSVWVKAWND